MHSASSLPSQERDAASAGLPDGFRFSTAGVAPGVAYDRYRSIFAAGAEVRRDGDRFAARLNAVEFARIVVHDRWLRDVSHLRDEAMVRRSDFSHFTVTLCLAGQVAGRSGDACVLLRPGEMTLLDMRCPGVLSMTAAHVVTVAEGREIVEAAGDARVFRADAVDPLRRDLVDLLAPEVADPVARRRAERLFVARRAIEAGLDSPDFNVAALARAVGVSRASLYRLFEPLGGVDRHIAERRLARVRRARARPGERASFAALAEEAGWLNVSHAHHVFLREMGERPGACRRRIGDASSVERAAELMRAWPGELR